MKKKLILIALLVIVAISALLFSGCEAFLEWLNEDENPNNGNPNNGNGGNGSIVTNLVPLNHIRAPAMAGATLTICSANPARPVTLTRGTSGDLFTVPNGATLIFKDIIIDGGGADAWGGAVINMTGGKIIGNNASSGTELRLASSSGGATFNQSGGLVAGIGANINAIISISSSTYNLNTASPNNAVVIAWNRATGTLNYTVGSSTDLTVSAGAAATWVNQGGVLGISYANGANTGG